ncbi:hypothetical protein A7K91_04150 [Paenibacillus oryzae]|uniref:Uncharacterized protein n=1 Tax=Paenibacillus oryzae TaxID=1844972 RepID=A0A1A5YGS3_9BACL|nr:hypothetical protein [Paenibacillus oryzae]OBR64784.1 hypothetical protein A7K91_04150 [Paenibacillus oryzae]
MRKPRWAPTAVIAVLAAGLLFGGYMLYSYFFVAAPLSEAVQAVPGVAKAGEPVIDQSTIKVSLELEKDASLSQVYRDIAAASKQNGGDRQLELDIASASSEELEQLWQSLLFQVAEAMENKTYSIIPQAVEQAAKQHDKVEASTEMDERNVYITLRKDGASKYMVLPRTGASLGVWSHA